MRGADLKILFLHNYYKISGGEDSVFSNEKALLELHNCKTVEYSVSNDEIEGFTAKLKAMVFTVFSFKYYSIVRRLLIKIKPDIVHVHNFFPLLTPSVFYAAKNTTPIVLTLHNYRTICPTSLLLFKGKPNERSLNESAYWAVPHKVYRHSFIGTFTLASMIVFHKKIGTWGDNVDRFICLTEFSRSKFITAGFPREKLVVKPNFTLDPGFDSKQHRNDCAVFIGRLSEEKGIDILLNAWQLLDYSLDVIGEGIVKVKLNEHVNLLGKKTKIDVIQATKSSNFIIVPSICYEGFPMAIVEAFACGTPVLCSRLGSMEEIVEDGVTGLHFEAGNAQDLAEKAQWLIDNPERTREMGQNARNEYLAKYTPEKNYEMLMDIYQQAIEEAKKR